MRVPILRGLMVAMLALALSRGIIFAGPAAAQSAEAPSFNCAKATYPDERTICSSAELSQLDNVANAGYQYVRRVYGSQYANSLDLPLLAARRACATDVTCIKAQQLAAIKRFQSLGAPVNALPATMSPPPNPRGEQLRESSSDLVTTSVPMRIEGGTYVVPVLINDAITLDFIVDSGASDVSIPADVVLTLMRTKTLKETDFLGEQTYVLADGSKVPSQTFVIRSLKVGNKSLENVNGSVASVHGGLLLGQTFLSRFKSWSVDNTKHALVLSD
jgi:uncharacterized protein